ncbi:NUDIX hydrolase [Streptomyces sp. NPDC048172]|uniref:NUDIX hydrolase n=1 Tax=Streptomyces sp. NPDC048172 TaxID=3365505 RepID=UPI003721399E
MSAAALSYVVNVCVALRRADRWLLIVRHPDLGHAGGTLSVPGGKVEDARPRDDVLEATARREAAEEVGVDLDGVPLRYAESTFFVSDEGTPVVNVVFAAHLPDGAEPYAAAPAEVSGLRWLTREELEAEADCPSWTVRNIRSAAAALVMDPPNS